MNSGIHWAGGGNYHLPVKPYIVVASGHFSLGVHAGHIDYLSEAARLGQLWVIVNNDIQVKNKLGQVYLPEQDRLKIVNSIKGVHMALLSDSSETDGSVCRTLEFLHRVIGPVGCFVNGGDVQQGMAKEEELCRKLGINCRYGVGGNTKADSSRSLLARIRNQS